MILENIHDFINLMNGYLWGPPMLIMLFGTHLYLTFRLRFIQKYTPLAIKLSLNRKKEGKGDVSQFGALMTALAATIGTGNIVGVATAVSLGGPGSVLWMWLTGVFGIATKYSEALLSVKYRVKTSDGTMLGGPMYALERGLGMKWLAVLFCVFTAIAAFGIGNMVQANSISTMLNESYSISPYLSGGVMTFITAIVILGGITSIAKVCEYLVPFMAIFYVLGCVAILIIKAAYIIPAIQLIIVSAFTAKAAAGGFCGSTIMMAARFGVARGLFSNESGLGSAPIVAAAAQTKNPVRQAFVSSTGTFWDTVVVCAMTGIVLVSCTIADPGLFDGTKLVSHLTTTLADVPLIGTIAPMALTPVPLKSALMTRAAFAEVSYIGPVILSIGLLTFVFSTILGWSYYGERAVEYLFGKASIKPYRVLWVAAVMAGSVMSLPLVWDFADMMNALMAIPNLIALLALSGVIVSETKKYLWEGNLDEHDPEHDHRIIETASEVVNIEFEKQSVNNKIK
ncbi:MAG TPA: sodium:alanine symporter family protein [Candidatus Wallbacteria bacterium]|nr:sodium:alanine symporter family protein [Candidatus Wallbacteria bacterium]